MKIDKLADVSSQYNIRESINENNEKIEEAFENTLSRDGSTPNHMEADLDLNSNSLLNVDNIDTNSISIRGVEFTNNVGQIVQTGRVTKSFIANGLSKSFDTKADLINKKQVEVMVGSSEGSMVVIHFDDYELDGSNIVFNTAPDIGNRVVITAYTYVINTPVDLEDFSSDGYENAQDALNSRSPNFESIEEMLSFSDKVEQGVLAWVNGVSYVRDESFDEVDVIVGWRPVGVITNDHIGFKVDDEENIVSNTDNLNQLLQWIGDTAAGGSEFRFNASDKPYLLSGTIVQPRRVRVYGSGVLPNTREAPLNPTNSTPGYFLSQVSGVTLAFCGRGDRNITIDNISAQPWFGRDIPVEYRPWANGFDNRIDLLELTNKDADEETPATLKEVSACWHVTGDYSIPWHMSDIRIMLACDGVSGDGGFNIDGHAVADSNPEMADYDFGIIVYSPWNSVVNRVNTIGAFKLRGLLFTPMDQDNQIIGYSESNIFTHCYLHGGTAIRAGDYWPVLSKTANSITVPWTDGHRFTAKDYRVGSSFTRFSTYTVTGVSYAVDGGGLATLTLTTEESTAGIVTKEDDDSDFDVVITSGGAGPASTVFQSCFFGTNDRSSATPEPAYNMPYKSPLEIMGISTRSFRLKDCVINPCSVIGPMFSHAPDLVLEDLYNESRKFRLTPGGDIQNRGCIWIAGEERDGLGYSPDGLQTTIIERGFSAHTSANRGPFFRVGSNSDPSDPYFWQDYDGDNFVFKHIVAEDELYTNLDTLKSTLRGRKYVLGSRSVSGDYQRHIEVDGSNGKTYIGENSDGNPSIEIPIAGEDGVSVSTTISQDLGDSGILQEYSRDGVKIGDLQVFSTGLRWQVGPNGEELIFREGSPEGVLSRPPGSVCINFTGASGSAIYFKETGTGNTGWAAIA